uniref:hypothetical protein n=1 Tax=Listeria monocytogenes TaxID=1639 RepID=UPI002916F6AF
DQTSNYKVTAGKITNDNLLIALSVRSETTIEDYEKIDKVTVHQENIEAKKLPDMKDEDGKVYKNVYQVNGQYSWHDKRYDFEWIGSYNKNDVNTDKGYILKYTSEMSGTHVDVNLTPVK